MVLSVLYFLLPAAVANMAPVFAKKMDVLRFLDRPIDNNVTYRGQPLLGKHKTWRGLFAGLVAACAVTGLQALLGPTQFDVINYSQDWLLAGVLLGFGAIAGDAIKSFFKRRMGVAAGSPWVPYDQTDFVIGALAATYMIYWPGWPMAVVTVAIFALLHVIMVWIGWLTGLKESLW
jgi:CDP-2,3-bis-(O-geranylgeranyl)-sn-glycerol synthase